ncbi:MULTISPECIES: hypothetical protein [Pseudomonas]|uniref:hypothetical protein n=1 Tax=Pseudomonas TaxID=286 RepID=UPI002093999C|nr:hypothetical protein [Pseudomonas siliginis]USU01725.1 hypothetical protein NF680_05500 [Pseudomonas siliginis]
MTEVHRYKAVTMISAAGATIGYDPHGPDVVMATEFDRVTAERDALQQRLNAADQRIDEMTAPIPDEPVTWGSPKTVRQLVHQLLMLDQDLEPWAMHRIPDFKDGKQVAAVHLSMSYERVEGRFLSDFKGDGRKIIAFWCKPDPRAEHPTLVAEKLVTRLAEEFPDSDTLLTVECVADLIKEYLTGL